MLVIDKETREPKQLLATQQRGEPWILIVTTGSGKNLGKKFASYHDATKMAKKVGKLHPDYETTIVSRRVGYGPPRSKITDKDLHDQNDRGRYWCPYCRKFREFEIDAWSRERCPTCRIPINNWHVIRNNPRLNMEMFYD